jgi:hypothetical protein
MLNKNLVLLSYGRESEYRRAIFCVLSFFAWDDGHAKDTRILIYTDKPEFFQTYLEDINIEYVFLTPALLDEMLGDSGFFHRRKVSVIDMTFKKFPNDNLLFIDSDTFFIAGHNALLNGFEQRRSFMHKREYRLKDGLSLFASFNQEEYPKAFLNYISGRNFEIDGIIEKFDENDYSWNSGVLGLNKDFAVYMPDVFKLTDEFYASSKWFICEQMAFSLILQRRTEIKPSDQFVLHYWGNRQKVLLDRLLEDLLHQKRIVELRDKTFIKSLTGKLAKKVEIDLMAEQIDIAYTQQNLLYGIKKSALLVLKNPFNTEVYKLVFNTLKL